MRKRLAILALFLVPSLFAKGIKVSGVVTFARGPDAYFFMETDEGKPWRVHGDKAETYVKPGDIVEVKGNTVETASTPRIRCNSVEVKERSPESIPKPENLDVAELVRDPIEDKSAPDRYARLVTVKGTVRDINKRQTFLQILVGDGEKSVLAVVPYKLENPLPEYLEIGAKVRVTGLYVYTTVKDSGSKLETSIENPNILTQDFAALEILSRAPFWTPVKLLAIMIAFVVVALSCGILAVVWTKSRERAKADAVRRERLRLSHDLHDGFQQLLAGSMFRLEAAINMLPEDAEASREQLEKVSDSLYHTQTGLRAALWSMTEESEGPNALSGLVRYAAGRLAHWEGKVRFEFKGEERRISRKLAGEILMILQEAVGNALRHGGAQDVKVVFSFREKGLVLSVRDDGCGFDPSSFTAGTGHLGLKSMKTRVEKLNGSLKVTSERGAGALIVAKIPYGEEK